MALIKEVGLKKVEKTRNSIHSEVAASYTSFQNNGEKYFHMDRKRECIRVRLVNRYRLIEILL